MTEDRWEVGVVGETADEGTKLFFVEVCKPFVWRRYQRRDSSEQIRFDVPDDEAGLARETAAANPLTSSRD